MLKGPTFQTHIGENQMLQAFALLCDIHVVVQEPLAITSTSQDPPETGNQRLRIGGIQLRINTPAQCHVDEHRRGNADAENKELGETQGLQIYTVLLMHHEVDQDIGCSVKQLKGD